jgi:alpha-L-rhamnosidase/Glycosyl hydrolases family 2, sugar binding domain
LQKIASMKTKSLFLFLVICIINSFTQPILAQTTSSLEQGFRNPPVSARPKALWPWVNGNVSLPQVTYELEEAKRKGMGGFDIWDIGAMVDPNKVIPAGPAFLSDESLQAIAYTIREADRLGLEIGLIFSSSWNAGGAWVKPEHGAMGLFRADTIIVGPQTFSSTLEFPLIPEKYHDRPNLSALHKNPKTGLPVFYKEVALIAHPYKKDSSISSLQNIINLQTHSNGAGKIKWEVPAGEWRIIRYVCAPTGQPLAVPSPNSNGLMLDHFNAEAQKANLNYIFNRLLPVTGSLKKRSLRYLVADSYEVNSAVWTPLLPEEFQKRNHYSLIDFLPLLDGFELKNKNIGDRFLFDFTKTLSDLIIENHYQLGRKICEQHGIGFCAEAGGPGQPIHNVPFEDLKALGALTVPRGEFWNKHPQLEMLQIVKGIASASHIYNQKYVEAESFTSVWLWQEGPDELKPLADRAMCEGLNRFVYHTFPHTPPESGNPGWVYNFGTLINTTNGWWPKSNAFHEYLARCSYLLQQGNFAGDVAFYYGDKAPDFVPPKHINESLGFGYDYDVVNTDAILNKMQVRNGRIYLPHGQYYEVLVLPNEIKINVDVLKKLEQMVAAGATIIGPKPSLSYGLNNSQQNDKLVQTIAAKLWGNCDSTNVKENNYGKGKVVWGKSIREVLLQKKVLPDVQLNSDAIDFIHRKTKGEEIYFIRNTKKETTTEMITFRVDHLQPELWNAETGEITTIPFYYAAKNEVTLPLSLTANGSCFIVFRSPAGRPQFDKKNFISLPSNAEVNIWYSKKTAITTTNGEWKLGSIHQTVQLPEPLSLNNPWILHIEQQNTGIGRDTMQQLIPLNQSTNDAIKYYSGNVIYTTNFTITKDHLKSNQRLLLDLGRVKEIAEVIVNGKNTGFCWHAPFQIDITDAVKTGENFLQVEVVNTINNRLIGDAKLPEQYRRMKSNITKLPNAWRTPFAEAPLLDAGLIGPVLIRFAQVLEN